MSLPGAACFLHELRPQRCLPNLLLPAGIRQDSAPTISPPHHLQLIGAPGYGRNSLGEAVLRLSQRSAQALGQRCLIFFAELEGKGEGLPVNDDLVAHGMVA